MNNKYWWMTIKFLLFQLENRANRLQNRLSENGAREEPERAWMDRSGEKSKKKDNVKKTQKKRKVMKREMAQEDAEAVKAANFSIRESKKAKRVQKIRSFNDNDDKAFGKKGKKKRKQQ